MEIFEKIGDTIVSAGKDVTEKAKELSSVAKLKMDNLQQLCYKENAN